MSCLAQQLFLANFNIIYEHPLLFSWERRLKTPALAAEALEAAHHQAAGRAAAGHSLRHDSCPSPLPPPTQPPPKPRDMLLRLQSVRDQARYRWVNSSGFSWCSSCICRRSDRDKSECRRERKHARCSGPVRLQGAASAAPPARSSGRRRPPAPLGGGPNPATCTGVAEHDWKNTSQSYAVKNLY